MELIWCLNSAFIIFFQAHLNSKEKLTGVTGQCHICCISRSSTKCGMVKCFDNNLWAPGHCGSQHTQTKLTAISCLLSHQAGKTIYSYLSGRPPKCYSVYKTSLPTQSHRYNWKTTVFWVTRKIRLAQNQLIRKKIPVDRYHGIFAHSPLETFHIKATLKANQKNELYTPHCRKKLTNGQRSVYLGVDTLRFSFVWESRKPTQHIKTEGRSKREEWSPSGRTQLTSRGTKRPKKKSYYPLCSWANAAYPSK